MARDTRFDEAISRWLEQSAPARLPDRAIQATFERTRRTGQHVGWRERLARLRMTPAAPAIGAAAVVVVLTVALGLGLYATQPRVGGPATAADPRIPYLDTWLSTDPDGSTLTMTIRASGELALEIVVRDSLAAVCSGAPSTMTGSGRLEGTGELVIPSPVYTCDDGSEPRALSGPPLEQQLRNLTFVYDRGADTLSDSLGGDWGREGAAPPSPDSNSSARMWPQSDMEEARRAQELADAGDPRYAWQVDARSMRSDDWDPYDAELFARFLREEFGWEAFQGLPGYYGGGAFDFIRCAAGQTNGLYPNDPVGRTCAPTIDEDRYERVRLEVAQPVRQGPSGIWVVTGWERIEPFMQVVPPTEAERDAFLGAFLQARIDGHGADQYFAVPDEGPPNTDVPLVYATTTGAPYEQSEFEIIEGPVWPDGLTRFTVRLFAGAGRTVVEQRFWMVRDDAGRLRIHYEAYDSDIAPTTENGQAVPVQYGLLEGAVTFRAPWPWVVEQEVPGMILLASNRDDPDRYTAYLAVVAHPRPIEGACLPGPPPADATSLARSIGSDPDLEATAPVQVTVAGIPALRMDVTAAPDASICHDWGWPAVVTGAYVDESSRMRLYLLDLPGTPSRILAIALTAPTSDFERAIEAEAPLLDSFEVSPR